MFQNLGRGNKHGRNDKEIPKISVLNDDISRLESMLHTRYTHVTHRDQSTAAVDDTSQSHGVFFYLHLSLPNLPLFSELITS